MVVSVEADKIDPILKLCECAVNGLLCSHTKVFFFSFFILICSFNLNNAIFFGSHVKGIVQNFNGISYRHIKIMTDNCTFSKKQICNGSKTSVGSEALEILYFFSFHWSFLSMSKNMNYPINMLFFVHVFVLKRDISWSISSKKMLIFIDYIYANNRSSVCSLQLYFVYNIVINNIVHACVRFWNGELHFLALTTSFGPPLGGAHILSYSFMRWKTVFLNTVFYEIHDNYNEGKKWKCPQEWN